MVEDPKPPKNPKQQQLDFSAIENEKDKANAELVTLRAENKAMIEEKKQSDAKLKEIDDKEKERLLKVIPDEEYKESSIVELQLLEKDRAKRSKGAERHPKNEEKKDKEKYFGQYDFNKRTYV